MTPASPAAARVLSSVATPAYGIKKTMVIRLGILIKHSNLILTYLIHVLELIGCCSAWLVPFDIDGVSGIAHP